MFWASDLYAVYSVRLKPMVKGNVLPLFLFHTDDGSSTLLRNADTQLPDYMTSVVEISMEQAYLYSAAAMSIYSVNGVVCPDSTTKILSGCNSPPDRKFKNKHKFSINDVKQLTRFSFQSKSATEITR